MNILRDEMHSEQTSVTYRIFKARYFSKNDIIHKILKEVWNLLEKQKFKMKLYLPSVKGSNKNATTKIFQIIWKLWNSKQEWLCELVRAKCRIISIKLTNHDVQDIKIDNRLITGISLSATNFYVCSISGLTTGINHLKLLSSAYQQLNVVWNIFRPS